MTTTPSAGLGNVDDVEGNQLGSSQGDQQHGPVPSASQVAGVAVTMARSSAVTPAPSR